MRQPNELLKKIIKTAFTITKNSQVTHLFPLSDQPEWFQASNGGSDKKQHEIKKIFPFFFDSSFAFHSMFE